MPKNDYDRVANRRVHTSDAPKRCRSSRWPPSGARRADGVKDVNDQCARRSETFPAASVAVAVMLCVPALRALVAML